MADPADCATSSSSKGAKPFDANRSPSPVARSSVDEPIPPARATHPRPKGSDPGCVSAALACDEGAPRVGVEGPDSQAQGLGGNDSNQQGREACIKRKPSTGAGAYQGRARQGVHDPDRLLPPFSSAGSAQALSAIRAGHASASLERSLSSISQAWSMTWKALWRMRKGTVHDRIRFPWRLS